MCLVALYFRVLKDAPVVVGANREEAYARGGEPPRILEGPLRAVGGVDPTAGGTWLGVNERGVLVAVLNRPKKEMPPRPRSRGLLARDLLGCASAAAAAERAADELAQGEYAGCNFLCVDKRNAVVLHAGDRLRIQELPAGIHLLTASDTSDWNDERQKYARDWLAQRLGLGSEGLVATLQQLCGLTGDAPMCLRRPDGGTVSSAVIALRRPLEGSTYRHAQGPPDVTPYVDYSHLLREIAPPDAGG